MGKRTPFYILSLTIFGILAYFSVKRDLIYEKDYPCDLRNRVVGARLTQDGISPYFYRWKHSDGIRYYDPIDFEPAKISKATSSPFFHILMRPISGFEQRIISKIWLLIEYLLFLATVFIALAYPNNWSSKILVLLCAAALLFTEAWKKHVGNGQLYIVIPFLCAMLFWGFSYVSAKYRYLLSGLIGTALVLVRPNAAFFFIPLLLLFRTLTTKQLLQLISPFILAVIIILASPFQRLQWTDYFKAIKEHTKVHQGELIAFQKNDPDLHFAEWEGIKLKDINKIDEHSKLFPHSENGNFFVLMREIFHIKIGAKWLMTLSISLIAFLVVLFYRYGYNEEADANNVIQFFIFGFCLYMISDLFSPIYRHQYYTVQWFFILLLFYASVSVKKHLVFFILITMGVILNIITTPIIKMEHTIGEYLILCTLLIYGFVNLKQIKIGR